MVLVLDNYDSFVWNVVHAAARVAPHLHLTVVRSDRIDAARAMGMDPSHLIVSPGPCGPREAGRSVEIIRALAGRVPILGICLGHQCIGEAFGMHVVRAPEPVHGSTSAIAHDGRGVFEGLESPLVAMRYHSLIVDAGSIDPVRWEVSAWLDRESESSAATERIVMGLRRRWGVGDTHTALLEGVQFHPESFGTDFGERMIATFLRAGVGARGAGRATGPDTGVPGAGTRSTMAS